MHKKFFLFFILFLLVLLSVFLCLFTEHKTIKDYRILACITSFNRPVFVSGQVLRLLNQSYPVDVSVSIKGVPQTFAEKTLLREWQSAIRSGKVKVRFDENRDQYSNFLDTVRNIDLNEYDYFCRVDDDDWYGPDYFKHVNEWLNKDDNIILSLTKNNFIIQSGEKFVQISKNSSNLCSPSMCFSREVIQTALELEEDLSKAEIFLEGNPLSAHRYKNEDRYLHRLSSFLGFVQERMTPIEDLSFGWQYPSVTRPKK